MAADSPTTGPETCPHEAWEVDSAGQRGRCVDCRTWLGPAAPSPVDTTEPPAETQQDDERPRIARGAAVAMQTYEAGYETGYAAALAARPSADTEKLRRVAELERLLLVERDARDRDQVALQRVRDLVDEGDRMHGRVRTARLRTALGAR